MFRFSSTAFIVAFSFFFAGCGGDENPAPAPPKVPKPPDPKAHLKGENLAQAREGFTTKLTKQQRTGLPLPEPPPDLFDLIQYPGPAGKLNALVSVDPKDGRKYPAIIWIVGGFGNSISDVPWTPSPRDNDQSAAAFWKAGVVTMYPSLRGGNMGPGFKEGLFGEVDDVIAAAEHLASLPYINPDRIYLGGHSVGGTLALLVAESTDKFRSVFSLGPVENTIYYGPENLPFKISDEKEAKLRAPIHWLNSIKSPTFIFEGNRGNIDSLRALERANKNPVVKTYPVGGADHFTIIRPVCEMLADRIIADIPDDSPGIEIKRIDVIRKVNE